MVQQSGDREPGARSPQTPPNVPQVALDPFELATRQHQNGRSDALPASGSGLSTVAPGPGSLACIPLA